MPGYSVNWGHKAPKTIQANESVIARNTIIPQPEPLEIKQVSTITATSKKWTALAKIKQNNAVQSKKRILNHIASNTKALSSSPTKVEKGQPQFFTGDEQEDDHARKSLVFGILSLGSPAATFLIMFGIVISVGGTLAKPVAYAAVIFALGCAGGLVFAIVAIINGIIAIREINAEPDTYVGTGDAILGMLLAALVPIGLATYLLLRFL